MTKQEAFNKMWSGLSTQGWMHSRVGTTNRLRNESGRCCPIGMLIPEHRYSYWMELLGVALPQLLPGCRGLTRAFLTACRDAHDDTYTPWQLRRALLAVAKEHNLSTPEGKCPS